MQHHLLSLGYYSYLLLVMVFGSLPISTATAQDSGIGLLKQMIAIAADNGGVGRTGELTALKQRIDALPKPARGDRKQARQANDKGLAAYKAGQYELAKGYFMLAYRSDPADAEIAGNLALAYLDLGDLKKVIETQTAALMLAPGRSASWVILARYYAQQDQQREAIACYALTFHFSQNQNKTREFLQKLATNNPDQPKVQQAAHQALQLSLIQGNSETVGAVPVEDSLDVPLPPAPPVSIAQPSLPTQTILYEGDNENPSKQKPNDVYMTDEEKFYTQNPEFLYRKFLVRDLYNDFIDAKAYAQLTNTSTELQNVQRIVISISNARLFKFMTIREKNGTWSMDDVLIDSGFGAQGDLNQNQRNQLFNNKSVFGGKLEPTLLKYIFDSKITIKRLFEDEDKIMGKIDVCMTEQKDLPPSKRQKDPKEYCLISIERNR